MNKDEKKLSFEYMEDMLVRIREEKENNKEKNIIIRGSCEKSIV